MREWEISTTTNILLGSTVAEVLLLWQEISFFTEWTLEVFGNFLLVSIGYVLAAPILTSFILFPTASEWQALPTLSLIHI